MLSLIKIPLDNGWAQKPSGCLKNLTVTTQTNCVQRSCVNDRENARTSTRASRDYAAKAAQSNLLLAADAATSILLRFAVIFTS